MRDWKDILGVVDHHRDRIGCDGCFYCSQSSLRCHVVVELLDALQELLPVPKDTDKYSAMAEWFRQGEKEGLLTVKESNSCRSWMARSYM